MKKVWQLTIWAAVLCACLAVAPIASAKPHHGKHSGDRAGRLDPSFGNHGRLVPAGPAPAPEANGSRPPQFTAVGPGGRVILAVGNQVRAFRSDGSPDAGFGEGGQAKLSVPAGERFHLAGVAIDSRGRILVAGQTESIAGGGTTPEGFDLPIPAIATVYRLLPNGQPDSTFGARGEAQPIRNRPTPATTPSEGANQAPFLAFQAYGPEIKITGLAVDAKNRPLLIGSSPVQLVICTYGSIATYDELSFAARLTVRGNLDGSFGSDGVVEVSGEEPSSPAALPNGGFTFATSAEPPCERIPQGKPQQLHILGANGSVTAEQPIGESDGPDGYSQTQGTAVDSRGRILVLSDVRGVEGGKSDEVVRRYLRGGAPDPSFGREGETELNLPRWGRGFSLAVDPAGRPVVAGTPEGPDSPFMVTRLTVAGRPDRNFGRGGLTTTRLSRPLYADGAQVATDAKGRITVSGRLTCKAAFEPCRPAIVRYLGG